MSTPLIRGGRIVGSPMKGMDGYDFKRLSEAQMSQMKTILDKSSDDRSLTMKDLTALIEIRRAARVGPPPPSSRTVGTVADIRSSISELRRLVR